MARQDPNFPGSVRIRTGDGNEWRFDEIERAAESSDCTGQAPSRSPLSE
ncbi:DUF7692 domain-containing protein [Natrinema sp. LN54]